MYIKRRTKTTNTGAFVNMGNEHVYSILIITVKFDNVIEDAYTMTETSNYCFSASSRSSF